MSIDEIKNALREVRRICKETSNCKFCPLSIDGCCPMTDELGNTVEYPSAWALYLEE